jgi:hypothetical protein
MVVQSEPLTSSNGQTERRIERNFRTCSFPRDRNDSPPQGCMRRFFHTNIPCWSQLPCCTHWRRPGRSNNRLACKKHSRRIAGTTLGSCCCTRSFGSRMRLKPSSCTIGTLLQKRNRTCQHHSIPLATHTLRCTRNRRKRTQWVCNGSQVGKGQK